MFCMSNVTGPIPGGRCRETPSCDSESTIMIKMDQCMDICWTRLTLSLAQDRSQWELPRDNQVLKEVRSKWPISTKPPSSVPSDTHNTMGIVTLLSYRSMNHRSESMKNTNTVFWQVLLFFFWRLSHPLWAQPYLWKWHGPSRVRSVVIAGSPEVEQHQQNRGGKRPEVNAGAMSQQAQGFSQLRSVLGTLIYPYLQNDEVCLYLPF